MNEWIGHWTLFSVVGRVKTGMRLSHTSLGYTVFLIHIFKRYYSIRARFGSTYTKIGTIQRRLAWPLRKDDTQIREAFQIFYITFQSITILEQVPLRITGLEVKAQSIPLLVLALPKTTKPQDCRNLTTCQPLDCLENPSRRAIYFLLPFIYNL